MDISNNLGIDAVLESVSITLWPSGLNLLEPNTWNSRHQIYIDIDIYVLVHN